MPSWVEQTCQRKTLSAFAITALVLLVFVAIYLTFSWEDIVKEDLTYDLDDDMYDDCRAKATVVTDKAMTKTWETSVKLSQAWSSAEQNAREPAHNYMEKHHSTAIYMYTNILLQDVKQNSDTAENSSQQLKETFESRSLYFFLSEAVQVLKHSQLTCLHTNYRTETLLNLNASNKLIRFSTFILGSDGWNLTRNASCFEVYTCFGADVTHYSALRQNRQVLIPPYEVFKVTGIETDAQRCKVVYRLKSNLNCIYDRESNVLHPISALPVGGLWLVFTISCIIIVFILLAFVIVKVLVNIFITSSLHNNVNSPARSKGQGLILNEDGPMSLKIDSNEAGQA